MAIITTDDAHYKNIAKTIRDVTNTEDEFYPVEMSEKIEEVAKASYDNGIRVMWEAIQASGARTMYNAAFRYVNLNKDTFKPLYDIVPTNASEMFFNCPMTKDIIIFPDTEKLSMSEIEKECGIVFDFSKCNDFTRTFSGIIFKDLNVIDITASTTSAQMTFTFYGGYTSGRIGLQRIERLIIAETNVFTTTTFQHSIHLTYIGFEGVIASDINVSWSPLVPESMKKAIMCLKNYSGTGEEFTKTIKFSEACWKTLEADSSAPDGGLWREYVGSLGWNT